MRLFFKDPEGQRLAIDTNRREWAATYANEETEITENHFFINVESPETLYRLEREADFCGYGYNSNLETGRGPQASVFTDLLQVLYSYSQAADANQIKDISEMNDIIDRIRKANDAGYMNAREYAILILLVDDITNTVDIYNRAQTDN